MISGFSIMVGKLIERWIGVVVGIGRCGFMEGTGRCSISVPSMKPHLPLLTTTPIHRSISFPTMIPEPEIMRCSSKSEHHRNQIFVKSMPFVVILTHTQVYGGLLLSYGGISTGFIVSEEGHIMMCAHCAGYIDDSGVVRDAFLVSETYVKFFDRAIPPVMAELVVAVPEFNILRIPSLPESLKPSVVTFSQAPSKIGDSCFVTGHPAVEFATRCGFVSSPVSDKAYFVDLFVRASNTPAIKMYEKLGYIIYRRVLRYYSGEEDGLDMRKALSRDVEKKSVIPLKRPVTPDELEYD